MKIFSVLALAVILALAFLGGCSSFRPGMFVKAEYDAEAKASVQPAAVENEEEGWASRYIPGWKRVSALIPPPTEARKEWDRTYSREGNPWFERSQDY